MFPSALANVTIHILYYVVCKYPLQVALLGVNCAVVIEETSGVRFDIPNHHEEHVPNFYLGNQCCELFATEIQSILVSSLLFFKELSVAI